MGVRDWSTTADDNGSSDPTINFAEGQMPSSVNNSARAMMAALAAYFADAGGTLISAGSSNAYTLTTNMGVTALGTPLTLMFEADRANTGAATLAVDGLTSKPMKNAAGAALAAGDIVDGGVYFAVYNVTADVFILLNVSAAVAAYLSQAAEVTVASAGTADILAAASTFIAISGTTTITSFGTGANRFRFVRATGAFLITHNATSLICPTGANITTAAGDTFLVVSDASSNARIFAYQRATGLPIPQIPTASIADKAVTYAKIQDVSDTARVLGRKTAGAGPVEEMTASDFLDLVGATRGSIPYRGASGWAILTPGTAGTILTSSGAGADPVYASAASAGKLGQVLQDSYSTKGSLATVIPGDNSIPTSSEGTLVLSQAITPASSSSQVLVSAQVFGGAVSAAASGIVAVFRGTTCIQARSLTASTTAAIYGVIALEVLDSPATGSSVTYSVRVGASSGSFGTNRLIATADAFGSVGASTLTLTEILP